jgi:hypothetical protein
LKASLAGFLIYRSKAKAMILYPSPKPTTLFSNKNRKKTMRTKKKITMMRRIPKLSPTNELSRSLKRRKKTTKPDYKL